MKKNITINLCGRLFQIDEDAYELLQQYIESLRQSFGHEEGGEEIVNDIEARIAELFLELNQQGIEAITIEHVKDIITRIGKPEELKGEEEKQDNGGHKYDSFRSAAQGFRDNVRARTAGKRLYRNPNDKMVAGVLSGIAAYTGSDVTWWRIGYAMLILASNFLFPLFGIWFNYGFFLHVNLAFIIFYFVLAIAIPVADTPKQVLEMEGKEVTPQNLADVVVEDKQPAQHRRGCLGSFFSVIISIFVGIFVGIAAIVGLVLLVCLLLIIVSLVVVFTVPSVGMTLPFDIDDRTAARPLHSSLCHRPHAVLTGRKGAADGHRTAHPVDCTVGGIVVLPVPGTRLDSGAGEGEIQRMDKGEVFLSGCDDEPTGQGFLA